MKERMFICSVIAAACICFVTCENPIIKDWWEGDGGIDTAVPVIIAHPQGAIYPMGAPAKAMTVTASVSNGGQLSYQWYSNDVDSNTEGTKIQYATNTSYTPPTNHKGVKYYYVVVTNTIANNGDERKVTANAISHTAGIGVDVPNIANIITVTGLSALNKVYDGTALTAVIGTPEVRGLASGSDVTIVVGTVMFEDANVGNDKAVIFDGWSLGGADAGNYVLQMPILKANILKADPVVNWPSGLSAYIGQSLSEINLPGNGTSVPAGTFTWTGLANSPDYSINKLNEQSLNMTFTPNDTLNYNTITGDVSIKTSSVKMVRIPAGAFIMGSSGEEEGRSIYEGPMRIVTLSGFYMSECEVTQELYYAVMGNNPSRFRKPVTGERGTPGKLPVENVSWYDALVFCNKLSMMEGLTPAYRMTGYGNSTDPKYWGTWENAAVPDNNNEIWNNVEIVSGSNGYRMPTEAQWEYACRAGTTTVYYTGDSAIDKTGWYMGNSCNMTHKAGVKPPNAWGLYDMHGNVYEWCWDWFSIYPDINQTDPEGCPQTQGLYRVIRGGSYWNHGDSLRSAFRDEREMPFRADHIGIRLVRPN